MEERISVSAGESDTVMYNKGFAETAQSFNGTGTKHGERDFHWIAPRRRIPVMGRDGGIDGGPGVGGAGDERGHDPIPGRGVLDGPRAGQGAEGRNPASQGVSGRLLAGSV
ncbi:protein of unknown function [Nitrospina watsonii]|uniref:Uncharacterized protein n=1 Tax=Nitrospina watsonii TaxID=1323948 RepID=A0ABM9HDS3_9BACT|nr:protein of unknown function [Nitrospina watsonii]